MAQQSVISVVDDDESVRESLQGLIRSVGFAVQGFASAEEFIKSDRLNSTTCLILDVRMPGMHGPELQRWLATNHHDIPIIFITGYGDIPMTVRAFKAGAVEFLTKPFRDQDILDAVRIALDRDRVRRETGRKTHDLSQRFEGLTPREREIIALVTAGLMNKRVAAEMGLSEATVKVHRHNLMKKLGARSVADLVRMADDLGISHARPM